MKHALSTEGKAGVPKASEARFVLCVRNKEYPASLELRKVYQLLPDNPAAKRHQVRVIDESGENYLYPEDYFVPIKLPPGSRKGRVGEQLMCGADALVRQGLDRGIRGHECPRHTRSAEQHERLQLGLGGEI